MIQEKGFGIRDKVSEEVPKMRKDSLGIGKYHICAVSQINLACSAPSSVFLLSKRFSFYAS
jgi:hypothetical protein